MSINRRYMAGTACAALLAAMALFPAGCGISGAGGSVGQASGQANGQADLISVSDIHARETVSQTAECVRGPIRKESGVGAKAAYPYAIKIVYKDDTAGEGKAKLDYTARLGEVNVKNGSSVKAGDVLATFVFDADALNIRAEQLAIQIKALTDAVSAEKERREKQISDAEAQIGQAATGEDAAAADIDAEIARVTADKIRDDLDYYLYTQDEALAELNAKLDEANAKLAGVEIKAPADGVIGELAAMRAGFEATDGFILMTLYPADEFMLAAASGALSFRYNMPVTLTVKDGAGKQTDYPAAVVSDAEPFYLAVGGGSRAEFTAKNTTLNVTGEQYDLVDVLLVPAAAVIQEDKKKYVNILEDGILKKRYVQAGLSDGTSTQIISGLDEGQVVAVR
ncbi:MAG: hypothetical protein FWC55_08980 [Firmicutes bacterium]|nr:hypothetical protein [Bacillota bacterium]